MLSKYRYEIKYVLDENKKNVFYNWIKQNKFFKKKYNDRIVNSIYLDDLNYTNAKENLIGLPNRKKFRFRWYNNLNESNLKFEIKVKNNRLNFKKNFNLEKFDKQNNLDLLNFTKKNIEYISKNHNFYFNKFIFPTLYVKYKREYYESDDGIRITLDDEININKPKLLSFINEKIKINYPKKILEIKFHPDMSNRVSYITKEFSFYPKRQSKYLIGLSLLKEIIYI